MDSRRRRNRARWRQKRFELKRDAILEQSAIRRKLCKTLYDVRAREGIRDEVLMQIVFRDC